jgi:hypothetical protein
MKALLLALLAALCLALAAGSALADWAVAQAPGGQPFIQRFRTDAWARQTVLDACRAQFDNCKVVISGGSGCVATATTGSKWGVGKGGNQKRADAAALRACEALDAGACRIDIQFCGQ